VVVADSVRLYVKQYRGHVFIGLKTPWSMLATSDLFIQTVSGPIHQLHASAQLGERQLVGTQWSDWEPAWRWGNAVDWYANEQDRIYPRDSDRMRPETWAVLQF
jgi:hypothetical protein